VTDGDRTRALPGGVELPLLGFGTWLVPDGPETENSVRAALELGYRHVDTAQGYGNEASVGRALRASGIPRDEVFITTKFNPGRRDPERELEQSLERLGVDRVDLYLVHTPQGGATRAWPGMERALERGLSRAIGVSNFDAGELDAVCSGAGTRPAVNQVQFSPFQHRRRLFEACARLGVAVEAWSPLNHGRELDHPTLAAIAQATGRAPAQVMLRWGLQRDAVVIPKSTHRERIEENARIFDFQLDDAQMAQLDALDRTGGTDEAVEDKWWTVAARGRAAMRRVAGRVRR
jgi:2,5-diketo-D-gluconate reductase A